MTVLRNWAPAELVRHIRISCAFVKYIQRNEIVLRDVEHSRRHHLVETDHFLILSPYEWKKQNEPTNERPNDTERYCVRLMKSDRKKKNCLTSRVAISVVDEAPAGLGEYPPLPFWDTLSRTKDESLWKGKKEREKGGEEESEGRRREDPGRN